MDTPIDNYAWATPQVEKAAKESAEFTCRGEGATEPAPRRSMVQAELMGAHNHETQVGVKVSIYQRDGKYLARGRYDRKAFGVTLGSEIVSAQAALRRLLTEIEDGTFRRPTEAKNQVFQRKQVPRLSLRELCNAFLEEKRRLRGRKTVKDYQGRLAPILDFAELKSSLKRWRLAMDLDRDFLLAVREYLINRQVTRNGRAGASSRPMSVRQVRNCLETLRMLLHWASRAEVRNLPPEFTNPVTNDVIGKAPPKDPLRKARMPMERRIQLVESMDKWQLMHLAILTILPLRFEDISGALISDVDFQTGALKLGTRFGGSDYNKGKVDVEMPLPAELLPLLRACIDGRRAGPLFRNRQSWSGKRRPKLVVESVDELQQVFSQRLATAPVGAIQTEQDRKELFRRLLTEFGGQSESYVGKQLRSLIGPDREIRPYEMRASVTQEMQRSGMEFLALRYLTEHAVNDIMNTYTGIDPAAEMAKYFQKIGSLLETIQRRARHWGIVPE